MLKRISLLGIGLLIALQALLPGVGSAADLTTKYRLYEENRIVKEYVLLDKAIADGRKLRNSHVEQISNRKWVWDNLPRYRVYQNDNSLSEWQYATLEEAKKTAKYYANSSIRDLRKGGWVWHNFKDATPRYRLMHNGNTKPDWEFSDLQAAQKTARYWANVHIIDLTTGEWVWDNLSPERKEELRQGAKVFQVYVDDAPLEDARYSYLEDAVAVMLEHDNAAIYNSTTNKEVLRVDLPFKVYQNDNWLKSFSILDDAVHYANQWAHAVIKLNNRQIWSNYPYYQVYQNERLIREFDDPMKAIQYAQYYANSSVVTLHQEILWDNKRKLQFWSWNGSARPDTIRQHVSQTMGLDVVSPTWFELQSADGTLKDTSDQATADWLKNNQYAVHPLVHNQFDAKLTSAFLSDPKAQKKFIDALVSRSAALGVDGINVDFESLAGKDRDRFTAFIRQLTEAAHAQHLTVSIDLPRGSVSWNHLTAFDHAALNEIVDYIITMAYDQYYSGSDKPGSVSGLQWAEQGIVEFLSYGIERDKLILGIPFYARDWKLDSKGKLVGNRSLLMKDIPSLLDRHKTTQEWDPQFNQYKVTYQEDGFTRVFWLEDEATIEARLKLAKKYDLAGVAAWRMGHEYASIWETMLKNK